MTTYLGMTPRRIAAYVAAAIALGVPLGLAAPVRIPAPCGYVVEGAERVPAACTAEADLQRRLDGIRTDRPSGRW